MNLFPATRTTPLPGGYMGKILRVNLTTGKLTDENLPEEPILKKFIGGQALALYILMNELPIDATPFGAENKVVMMTGPLTGNGFTPGGTKMTAVYLSPLTNKTLGRGATSGYWATYLKAAGYDGVIVEGVSDETGLSLRQRRQGGDTRWRQSLGSRHPRHRRPPARNRRQPGRQSAVHRPRG